MGIITEIFAVVSAVVTGFFTAFGDSVESVVGVIWTGTELSVPGVLVFIGLGFTFASFGIGFVMKLVRQKRA